MDPDAEVECILRWRNGQEEDRDKWKRPPSSYGSMKSDDEGEEEENEMQREVVEVGPSKVAIIQRQPTAPQCTGLQLMRSESPETLYTFTTLETKPPEAVVIDTRQDEWQYYPDEDEEEREEILIATSPEPPEPPEPDEEPQMDENGQPGSFHLEQNMPHIFTSILNTLKELSSMDMILFKMRFQQWEPDMTLTQVMDGDILDLVDKIIEVLGPDRSLLQTINTLQSINKKTQAEQLQKQCDRALIRYHLKQYLIRKHHVIREGVVQAGKQSLFDKIYVEPQISTCGFGGVDPSHALGPHPASPPQVPSADSFVSVSNLFRLQKDNGQPVRTVLTTGIPGIGMSVSVAKFCLDWAELRTNRDLQFVIKLSFRKFSILRNNPKMSLMEVIEYYHPECKNMKHLEEEDCKFLIIMDSLDCYQAALDWKNAPEITSGSTPAHPDVLIVNLIRGTLLPGARIWILGRRAAVSQIPVGFIDAVTEIQGFSDEMKDDYLSRRFSDADMAHKVVEHYKRLPTLKALCHQPFVCWMVATVFERCFREAGYGANPPRLTPFYINILVIQTNRKLQFYRGQRENNLNWSADDKTALLLMGKMAFKMLQKNVSAFFEEDVKEAGLKLTEVAVFSGLCTELAASSNGTRRFCFIHLAFQDFMAALYIFMMFRTESKNVLASGSGHTSKHLVSKDHSRSAAGLLHSALQLGSSSPPGRYDMLLRFLCGMFNPDCSSNLLGGCLFTHNEPKVGGLQEATRLLERTMETASAERAANLKECLREMAQEDK